MPKQLKLVCFILSGFEEKRKTTRTHTDALCNLADRSCLALFTALALITAVASGQCPIGLEILFYNLRTVAGSQCLCFPASSQAFLLVPVLHVFYYRPRSC